MADKFLCVSEAADLALLSDSDESLIENESDGDDDLLSDNDVGNRSDDASHGIDISDEESSDPDVLSTSLAAQRPHTMQELLYIPAYKTTLKMQKPTLKNWGYLMQPI